MQAGITPSGFRTLLEFSPVDYLPGTLGFFAAFLALCGGILWFNNPRMRIAGVRFGPVELWALSVTALASIGLALFLAPLFGDFSAGSLAVAAQWLLGLVVASALTWRGLRRIWSFPLDSAGTPIVSLTPAEPRGPIQPADRPAGAAQMHGLQNAA